MNKKRINLLYLALLVGLTVLLTGSPCHSAGLRDRLEGLVYEVEDWTEPKAWLKDKTAPDKWTLWTKEENVIEKRSNGAALHTPHMTENRKTPEEGAPPLHTKITGIPNGFYKIYSGPSNRPLAWSFDGGKTWKPGELVGEEFFGIFQIKNGIFEVWVDDRYASETHPGWSYYDYIRLVPTEMIDLKITDLRTFTLPDGTTQLSWMTPYPTAAADVRYGVGSDRSKMIHETERKARNHQVALPDLPKGENCSAEVSVPVNRTGTCITQTVSFQAGARPVPNPTQTTKIRLTVKEPTNTGRTNWPVTSGVPFAQGVLASENDVQLAGEDGRPIPAQFHTLSQWPDGSVKWLLCSFRVSVEKDRPTIFQLQTNAKFGKLNTKAYVERGAAFDKVNSNVSKKIIDFMKTLSSKVTLADGRTFEIKPDPKVFTVEYDGPIATTVRGSGDYSNRSEEGGFRWRCDLTVFGNDFVRVRWSVGNVFLKEKMTLVKSADLTFDNKSKQLSISDGKTKQNELRVLQGYEKTATVELDGKKSEQSAFDGLVKTDNGAFFLRDFQQTWPKGLRADKKQVVFEMLPALPKNYKPENADSLDELVRHYYWLKDNAYLFKRGMEVRNDFWFVANSEDADNDNSKARSNDRNVSAEHFQNPLFAVCDPEYYCKTGTFPPVNPVRKGEFDSYEKNFRTSFDNLEKGRRQRGEFGWMNFGDWFGERVYNWGNNEYDASYVCALQFIRSGNVEFLTRGIEMARHYSTIDFKAYPWDEKMRERMYFHCYGHVNGFFTEDDPRVQKLKGGKEGSLFNWESDGSGGHAFQPGNYYIGCLTGDRRIFEVAEEAAWNQAERYTPQFDFSIERSAGWALANAVYSYNFTGNPFYLNAANIYFEKILEKQNKTSGCFDLPQDLSECDCPDKKEHRGGKAFAVGILLHSLVRYYEINRDPKVKDVIVRAADWLLDESWNEARKGFRYKTGCPKFANSGWYTILVTEGIAYAGELTKNKRYIEFLARTLGPELEKPSGSGVACGKDFSQRHRQTPHVLYYLQKNGYKNTGTVEKK